MNARERSGPPPGPPPGQVAVVVLTCGGGEHLGPCLEAVLALEGLPGREAVVVVDNGSADGAVGAVCDRFRGIRTLRWSDNLGFAEGYNRAVSAIDAPHILMLNDDTSIAPDALGWLWREMSAGARCVGARLVSWDGRRIDFDGGGMALTGHGHPLGHGRRVPRTAAEPGPTLFCSGAAMLVHRATFQRCGGFDPAYFAYYEDVDLGCRFTLAGHRVRHVSRAVVRHRGGGSAGLLGSGRGQRLHERNAITTVAKCFDDRHLGRLLPAVLSLAAFRAGAPMAVIDAAEPPRDAWPPVPPAEWAGWEWLTPLALDFPRMMAARDRAQSLRRQPDAAVVARMAGPYAPVPPTRAAYAALERAAGRFGLAEIFGPSPTPGRTLPRTAARAGAALRRGGPSGLVDEARGYLAWRRGEG